LGPTWPPEEEGEEGEVEDGAEEGKGEEEEAVEEKLPDIAASVLVTRSDGLSLVPSAFVAGCAGRGGAAATACVHSVDKEFFLFSFSFSFSISVSVSVSSVSFDTRRSDK